MIDPTEYLCVLIMVNVLKFRTLFFSFFKYNVGYQGCNSQNASQIANREDPDQTNLLI